MSKLGDGARASERPQLELARLLLDECFTAVNESRLVDTLLREACPALRDRSSSRSTFAEAFRKTIAEID